MSKVEKILVTGGAGYIGSHIALRLKEKGFEPVVFDNLVYGHSEAALEWELVEGDLADKAALETIFKSHNFDAVMHFAAYAYVGESVENPSEYYQNNVANGLNLLDAMVKYDVKNIIFSSTCATYGEPVSDLIGEDHPQNPINPYGESKLFFERILQRYRDAYGIRSVSLRYFNAAGADPEGRLGESHDPETHLIPLVLKTAKGERESIMIFGDDYDTPDGTCIRDYIHILDLADAHILALDAMKRGETKPYYNLGNGLGFSVKEVIECARKVTGVEIPAVVAERRPGDPARLIAKADLAKRELGWTPSFPDLEDIIKTAWQWEQSRKF